MECCCKYLQGPTETGLRTPSIETCLLLILLILTVASRPPDWKKSLRGGHWHADTIPSGNSHRHNYLSRRSYFLQARHEFAPGHINDGNATDSTCIRITNRRHAGRHCHDARVRGHRRTFCLPLGMAAGEQLQPRARRQRAARSRAASAGSSLLASGFTSPCSPTTSTPKSTSSPAPTRTPSTARAISTSIPSRSSFRCPISATASSPIRSPMLAPTRSERSASSTAPSPASTRRRTQLEGHHPRRHHRRPSFTHRSRRHLPARLSGRHARRQSRDPAPPQPGRGLSAHRVRRQDEDEGLEEHTVVPGAGCNGRRRNQVGRSRKVLRRTAG